MQMRSKIMLFVVVAVTAWCAETYIYLGTGPTMTAEMAVQQLKNGSNINAENIRLVDTSKNFFAFGAALAFGFVLFASNIWHCLGAITGEQKTPLEKAHKAMHDAVAHVEKLEKAEVK